jgi:hypothetical protein
MNLGKLRLKPTQTPSCLTPSVNPRCHHPDGTIVINPTTSPEPHIIPKIAQVHLLISLINFAFFVLQDST